MAPPFEQHRVADQLEPRRELQSWLLEHLLQLVRRHIPRVAHFVGVHVQLDVRLDEQNVVNWVWLATCPNAHHWYRHTLVLSPLAITGRLVVDAGEELELVQRHLLWLDTQLVFQLALRRALHTQHGRIELRARLSGDAQGVGAAGVRPHVGEGDLLGRTLLKQQALVRVEEENGEGTVEEAAINVGHQVACEVAPSAWTFFQC